MIAVERAAEADSVVPQNKVKKRLVAISTPVGQVPAAHGPHNFLHHSSTRPEKQDACIPRRFWKLLFATRLPCPTAGRVGVQIACSGRRQRVGRCKELLLVQAGTPKSVEWVENHDVCVYV
eukprot:scaffold93044_cov62-Phaeocystis_antarctica.AAC.6